MSFAHLHVHTAYSLLDGFSDIKKLVRRVRELEMPAVAITDHGTMFGVIEFYNQAVAAGVHPIIGLEGYLAARGMQDRDPKYDKQSSHLLLLAENQTGYQNLLKIASAAQLEGFYYYPRVDKDFLARHSEGLICTSGCMAAEIPRTIMEEGAEAARKKLDWYYEVFGAQNFFLELQQHHIPELDRINQALLSLGERYRAKYIATNDVHYINPEDARLQDILLAVQTSSLLSDPKRMRMTDDTYYLRTPQEMQRIFAEVPEALSNTLLIAERCQVDLTPKGYHLPLFDVPEGYTPETYLRHLCEQGLPGRYGARTSDPEVRARLDYELGIIHQMGFDTYFLIVWDLCCYARTNGIWYNARGSAAGSIVAYVLGITLVDPIHHGLIFERFLNPGRISMPDIDLDFQDDLRPRMLEYCARKYGDDKVAQIITFGTMGARAAVRDVGRVMDIPISEVDRVAKLIPSNPANPVTLQQALEETPELKAVYQEAPYFQELLDTAARMEGAVRNAGTHAAGVVITDKPIVEYIPLHRPTSTNQASTSNAENSPIKTVTQFEMSIVESLGLLKVDFLGLATLSIMSTACRLIRERHGVDLNLYNIPIDDPETFQFIGEGHTAGVFQLEGSGMTRYITQMKPKTLANVIAMVALYRPGPLEFIPSYIKRMHGEEKITYTHPLLEPILNETYGITVYQEQIMFTAMKLAGYTASEADNLRKGVAKKKADVLMKHRQTFVEGATKNGIPLQVANQIFDDWEAFARYGFPKGHAADYGVIAVETAYLKCHYTAEYMTALLSSSKNETEKVAFYVADCRNMGIAVLPPDVNTSGWDFTIEDQPSGKPSIRFGMGAVKNVGQGPVEMILEARKEGPFTSLTDFARRVDLRQVGKRALESLIRVGALDRFGARLALLEAIDRILAVSSTHFRAMQAGQMMLFDSFAGVSEEVILSGNGSSLDKRDILAWERELIGLYVSDHPLSAYLPALQRRTTHTSATLAEARPKEQVVVAGMVTRIRNHQSKAGKPMAFVTIEDIQGEIEIVVFPRVWDQYGELVQVESVLVIEGKADTESKDAKVLADKITTLTDEDVNPVVESVRERSHTPPPAHDDGEVPWDTPAADADDWGDLPPPPEPMSDYWEVQPHYEAGAAPPEERTVPPQPAAEPAPHHPPEMTAMPAHIAEQPEVYKPAIVLPGYVVSASAAALDEKPSQNPRMITVIIRSSGEKHRDTMLVRRIHGHMMTYPGSDKFAFHLFEGARGYLLEFPNETTGICPELIEKLKHLVGENNVRIDPIRVQ